MPVLPIHIIGSKALKKKAIEITDFNDQKFSVIMSLFDTLKSATGSGLAANQIGLQDAIFIVDLSYVPEEDEADLELSKEHKKPMVFINPVIEKTWDSCDWEEGCLSIPKLNANVTRPDKIRIKYRDGSFTEKILETGGFLARVIQHEYDHLQGILFTERLGAIEKLRTKKGLKKIIDGEINAKYKYTFG